MVHLSDFVSCSKSFYFWSGGVYISGLEHCRKIKFRIQLYLTLVNTIIFKTCHASVDLGNVHVHVLYLKDWNKYKTFFSLTVFLYTVTVSVSMGLDCRQNWVK